MSKFLAFAYTIWMGICVIGYLVGIHQYWDHFILFSFGALWIFTALYIDINDNNRPRFP